MHKTLYSGLRKWALFTFLLLFAGEYRAAVAQDSRCLKETCFPVASEIASSLSLRGLALFEYFYFDVYSGAFYAEAGVDTVEKALAEKEKVLVLHYHRAISRDDLIESTEKIIANNPGVTIERVRPQLEKLYKAYVAVAPGDRYSIHFKPAAGSTLYYNGRKLEHFSGVEFQRAFFGIWLSDFSVSEDFTTALLGRKAQ